MNRLRDEFLSEEDLDLRSMTQEELFAHWDFWLKQAQATNDADEHTYSHGVFTKEPPWPKRLRRVAEERMPYGR